MPNWEGSDRRSFLPSNWPALRQKRFRLDGYQCTAKDANTGLRCTGPAEECDHIGDREDHRIEMLRSLCSWHHRLKTDHGKTWRPLLIAYLDRVEAA